MLADDDALLHLLRSETCIGPVQLALELSLASYHIGLRTSFDVARYHIRRRSIYALDVASVQYLFCLFSAGTVGQYAL